MTTNSVRSLRIARIAAAAQCAAAVLVGILGLTAAGFALYTLNHHPDPDSLAGLGVALGAVVAAVAFAVAVLLGVLASHLPGAGARTALTATETVLAVVLFATAREALGNPVGAAIWIAVAATVAAVLGGLARRDEVSAWRDA